MIGPATALSTAILFAGFVTDIRTRKIPNKLILICAGAGIVGSFAINGVAGITAGLTAMATACLMSLPLVLVRALGAGDMKLLMALGLSTDWNSIVAVSILALFWAALLGFVQSLRKGEFRALVMNTVGVLNARFRTPEAALHRIPYAAALLLAWLTHIGMVYFGATL